MGRSVSMSTIAPLDNKVARVETLQGYLAMLDAILGVCCQADREGDTPSQALCGKAILAICRELVCGHLKRMKQTPQTPWERGFTELLEGLWEAANPLPEVSDAELMRRVQKAQRMAGTLQKLLSSLIVLESVYPLDVEEALERIHAEDGAIPF